MRQKELRIALVCYGGISLAVYMHGITKELWYATRASRDLHRGHPPSGGVEQVYRALLDTLHSQRALRLRLLPDIVSGASAGGINGVFFAQALATGQSLEPLTRLWLEKADVDVLLDPDAKPWSRFAKFWAQPIVWFVLKRPGNVVSRLVVDARTRSEVRLKVSRLIRARWFAPPFSGIGFSRLLAEALSAMAASEGERLPLLPPGHPLDLQVTATDFNGHLEELRLNSPPLVEESEHRLAIGFRRAMGAQGADLTAMAELVLAARATASFPGAFPPLMLDEIDRLCAERGMAWPGRAAFLQRIMPSRWRRGQVDDVALVDGAVLVNRPFAQAMAVLRDRPARREVDRRFVYIDPSPDAMRLPGREERTVGFFSAIFGSLSSIPREQPIRDNLEAIERQSNERARLRGIVDALRPEIEEAVGRLFGHTLFFDSPTPKRLTAWRNKAQQAAAEQAGFAFHGYAQVKLGGIVADLARLIAEAGPPATDTDAAAIEAALWGHLRTIGLDRLALPKGGASAETIAFFRAHDLSFRIRRLKLLVRRLSQDWTGEDAPTADACEAARDIVFRAQALYQARETVSGLGGDFPAIAARVLADPGAVLAAIAQRRDLTGIDLTVDALLVTALERMEKPLRRRFLHAYLGFPFYDVATLPLLQGEGMGEFDPIKVDRISPDDAMSIRKGGTRACLRGIEFFNFGAFFSRAYRENDYLWGRLHGAERTIDLIASTADPALPEATLRGFKREAFLAILEEERIRLTAEPGMVDKVAAEIAAAFPE